MDDTASQKTTQKDVELQDRFLEAFIVRKGITDEALKDCNISRPKFYGWLASDQTFRERFDQYRIALVEEIESTAVQRVLSPAGNRGSDQLVTTLLKGLRKERYAEKDSGGQQVAVIYVSGLRDTPRVGVPDPTPALPAPTSEEAGA